MKASTEGCLSVSSMRPWWLRVANIALSVGHIEGGRGEYTGLPGETVGLPTPPTHPGAHRDSQVLPSPHAPPPQLQTGAPILGNSSTAIP